MADLFQIGLSGIYSSQASLNTTSHNIANVNTEGYSRQSVEISTAGADRSGNYFVGRGSMISGIERAYDQFAFTENMMNTSQFEYAKEVYQQSSQLDTLLSSSGTSVAQPVLNMFESINGVADSPNTLESRQVFLESANNTVAQYNRLYDSLEVQYSSINNDITNSAKEISSLAGNLASLNQQISAVTGAGVSSNANDLLDQRDQIVTKLSQYVDVSVVPSDNAMINVYIGSGQSLVMGGTALQMLSVNGDPDPSRKELALSVNGNLAVIDGGRLGGSVAGLFDARNNDVERAFNQLGQNVIGLTHAINEQQKQGMTLDGEIGGNLFNDLNAPLTMQKRVLSHDDGLGKMQLSVRIDDLSKLSPDEFDLVVEDYQAGPPETLSFTATNRTTGERLTPLAVDMSESQRVDIPGAGISIGIDSIDPNNLPQKGKSFSLRPTRLAAQEATVQLTDPEKVAAADAEIKTIAAQANNGNALLRTSAIIDPSHALYMDVDNPLNIDIISIDPASGNITYDVVDKNGATALSGLTSTIDPLSGKATFAFAGVEVEMVSGSAQAGDSFSLNFNETGAGDNSNMLKIADLQNQKIMNGNKATIADVYSGMISEVGAKTANADTTMQTMEILQNQSFERMQSMSGVNMDEEAANLLQFQQHYSAAARVISVASELFDTILQASR
ncbi:flagellar hook-associated protein FlgK [Psychromonas marina]|uniref:Flagellar hook-associated protein 1 n=1 Tax=Psychromonas marina TaxID=88364 RepID=A0ABQ6DVY8_9GAMM|nr:flagellar hook-associated protein FlgK [Psychromonas marina]GLS89283.1 flagellar hook-associated protein FlgK [Psychromonas marina]